MYTKFFLALSALAAAVNAAPLAKASGIAKRQSYSGDVTYYTPGLGSCGETNGPSDYIVALSTELMSGSANPNDDPNCNRAININYGGTTYTATVVDTCEACATGSIDVTPGLFTAMTGSLTAGRLYNVDWSFA